MNLKLFANNWNCLLNLKVLQKRTKSNYIRCLWFVQMKWYLSYKKINKNKNCSYTNIFLAQFAYYILYLIIYLPHDESIVGAMLQLKGYALGWTLSNSSVPPRSIRYGRAPIPTYYISWKVLSVHIYTYSETCRNKLRVTCILVRLHVNWPEGRQALKLIM